MYKVLHIMGCSDVGGISTVVLNYYRNIDRNKIHFDIAIKTEGAIGRNGRALQALGASVYYLPLKSKNIRKYVGEIKKILMENHYDAIHVHEGTTSFVALRIAKKCHVRQRIAHSHTSSPDNSIKDILRRKLGQLFNFYYATNIVGCGRLAGERVFGKYLMKTPKAMILPNAVDTDLFFYDPLLRNAMRTEMNVGNKYVLGMVGRLSPEKNIPFALELVQMVREIVPDVLLLIAGEGDEHEKIEQMISEKSLGDCVALLGNRNDIYKLYNVFDIFLLPSFHEGFPVAAVEAMACGLPTLLSDNITDELSFGDKVFYLSLNDQRKWLQAILDCMRDEERQTRQYEIRNNGLDIKGTIIKLEKLYLEHM